MEKHRLYQSDLFWVLSSVSVAVIFLLLVFQSNMFSGSFEMIHGDGTFRFPRVYTSILVIIFTCFLVFHIKNRYPGSSTRFGAAIERVTGLGFICFAAILNLVMIIFTIATSTVQRTSFGEVPMPFLPEVLVVTVLTLSMLTVLVLLCRNVSGKNQALA